MGALELKLRKLRGFIRGCSSVVVAFSGGVDSSVLAAVSFKELGVKAVAVTLDSPTLPRSELSAARRTARLIGIRHVVVRHSELSDKSFVINSRERCYHCKKALSSRLKSFALKKNLTCVLEGTNASELSGHRPGFRALSGTSVLSPLAVLGFTKEDVRVVARKLGLPNHDKPSSACLSSRIPYGTRITARLLRKVEAAEDYLKRLGVRQVRVRCFGELAVIEVWPDDFSLVTENSKCVARRFNLLRFSRVTLDLSGYRTGSMD